MKFIFSIISALLIYSSSNAGIIVIEGKYQNKNLFVQNGFSSTGVGYCTYEVTVNGFVSADEINSSAFEIDFSQFPIKNGSEVIVEIKHKEGCKPKILNPEALKAQATFEVISMNISKEGLLKWSSQNESGPLPYIIEQKKWNKWVPVGEVSGNGSPELHEYSYQTTPHSGENKFRIKQIGYGAKVKYSKSVSYVSTGSKVTFTSSGRSDKILFSGESLYEIWDDYGNILKKGFASQVDIGNLKRGNYILCYDNTVAEFQKK